MMLYYFLWIIGSLIAIFLVYWFSVFFYGVFTSLKHGILLDKKDLILFTNVLLEEKNKNAKNVRYNQNNGEIIFHAYKYEGLIYIKNQHLTNLKNFDEKEIIKPDNPKLEKGYTKVSEKYFLKIVENLIEDEDLKPSIRFNYLRGNRRRRF